MTSSKLHGRAFYDSIGSPKCILAPMVDASEFAWRLLTRSFLPPDLRRSILAYSPMMHAKMFADNPKYRDVHFKPLKSPLIMAAPGDSEHQKAVLQDDTAFLDGNAKIDRPLFVQFCANDPDVLLDAAKIVQPYCDAVDLNLGCPQGIAKRGNYGAFLQEDWDTVHKLINTLHEKLDVPVTAKMRILETKERTLEYARMILNAGASIITVHGRLREQKGHNTGVADWNMIRYLRHNLPKETVIFANGNILQQEDMQKCIDATGVDGVMSAEGNLYDPSIFTAAPDEGKDNQGYWYGKGGKGGWRMDVVFRRYMDIIYEHVLNREPPSRTPLFTPTDAAANNAEHRVSNEHGKRVAEDTGEGPPPTKKQRRSEAKSKGKVERPGDVNLTAMQAHLFHLLRPLIGKCHDVRDALARTHAGDMEGYENVLRLVQAAVRQGILAYEKDPTLLDIEIEEALKKCAPSSADDAEDLSVEAIRRCKRPYFICQAVVRPLPKAAMEKGSMQLSKKEKARLKQEEEESKKQGEQVGVAAEGTTEVIKPGKQTDSKAEQEPLSSSTADEKVEIPREGLVCG